MKVLNKEKTEILTTYDLYKGYLLPDKLEHKIPKVVGVKEQGHYKTIKEYPNGGKDVEWVIDVKGVDPVEEHVEYEDIMVYIPYSQNQLVEQKISKLKQQLADMDYKTSKYVDGDYTETEWQEIAKERQSIRERIRELEKNV